METRSRRDLEIMREVGVAMGRGLGVSVVGRGLLGVTISILHIRLS